MRKDGFILAHGLKEHLPSWWGKHSSGSGWVHRSNQEAENGDYQRSAGFLFVFFLKEEVRPGTQPLDGAYQN